MSINRTVLWLMAGIMLLAGASTACGQFAPGEPLILDGFTQEIDEVRPFAPMDISQFGSGPQPNEGLFFNYQRAAWHFSPPDEALIGTGSTVIGSVVGISNSFLDATTAWGNIYEFGWIQGEHGLMARIGARFQQIQINESVATPVNFLDPASLAGGLILPQFQLVTLTDGRGQSITFAQDINANGVFGPNGIDSGSWSQTITQTTVSGVVTIVTTDVFNTGITDGIPDASVPAGHPSGIPPAGTDFGDATNFTSTLAPNAPIFDTLTLRNDTEVNSAELMYVVRPSRYDSHSWIEYYAGARYFQFDDSFSFVGISTTNQAFGNSNFVHEAHNHIVGPQIGVRLFRRCGRLTINGEGRLTAGANFRRIEQQGVLGDAVVPGGISGLNLSFANSDTNTRFAPLGEVQVSLDYHVTDAVALTLGYTGMFADGISRASNTIVYEVPTMGILSHSEAIFINGVNFGVKVNR